MKINVISIQYILKILHMKNYHVLMMKLEKKFVFITISIEIIIAHLVLIQNAFFVMIE